MLGDDERALLRDLPGQLRKLLEQEEPESSVALGRLFPPAYRDDPERDREFKEITGGQLRADRLSAIETMEETLDAETLTGEELSAWLSTVNDLRLVFGTWLGVTEETGEEDFAKDESAARLYGLYLYLTYLEDYAVRALSRDSFG
jgi:hypothetical protein